MYRRQPRRHTDDVAERPAAADAAQLHNPHAQEGGVSAIVVARRAQGGKVRQSGRDRQTRVQRPRKSAVRAECSTRPLHTFLFFVAVRCL